MKNNLSEKLVGMNSPKPKKKHYCFNCGEETDDYEGLPNGRNVYICDSNECYKELRETCREMEQEARRNAEEDGYSAYY
jgi:hypothetical protein